MPPGENGENHIKWNCYPPAPEKLAISDEMLSPYSRGLKGKINIKGTSTEKLIPNLMPKKRYICHYRNLQTYVKLGVTLSKIHRVIQFSQTPWLAKYVEFNTEKRKNSKNEFEKSFFKLLINSVFGKNIESVRNRLRVNIYNGKPNQFQACVNKPSFEEFRIFSKDLVGVKLKKINICLNKPVYSGFTILETSKLTNFDFHYDFVKKKYGEQAKLLYCDTDSLAYFIETENLYDDMSKHKDLFDFSDYPKDHPLYDTANKKKLGKWKDEFCGMIGETWVALRAKMYSIKYGEKVKKTAKGLGTHTVKHHLRHIDYEKAMDTEQVEIASFNTFRSVNHNIGTVTQQKAGLNCFDDKRYVLNDKISTYAYGHYMIPQ